jgi:DNA-binding response OmpR family regulator
MTETHFTNKEARVLDLLEQNRGSVVTRKFLLENVWGYNGQVRTRTLDVHISRLRAKLATDENVCIHAVAVLGYLLERRSQPLENVSGGKSLRRARRVSFLFGVAVLQAAAND